ncbi:MAG: hypothetical protein E6J90_15775 [Deltaproteobacteria bacterium]|nr:MAG: hypothetical protein E6J91_05510 [Deltaproteobacteria bacterium]TMQ20656.1 MAG: hypothetical protein E6J90_15775 [Deltaproteobacteria bacterium]
MTAPRTIVLLTLASVAGCASDGGRGGSGSNDPGGMCQPIGGAVTGNETVGRFDYKVTGGFAGQGDGTSLQIDGNGLVMRHTMQHGTESGQIDPATLQDLVAKARAAQFPTLCAQYTCTGCDDDLIHSVSVQLNGIPYMVQASELASAPQRLEVLIQALQQILERPLS